MIDFTSDIYGRDAETYRDADPKVLADLKRAAKECSGFATLTAKGAILTRHVDILDEHDPRGRAYNRLQWLHLKAARICDEI